MANSNSKFYQDLINLFFHPESYFSLCVSRRLDNPLIKRLYYKLITAESAVHNLEELSQVKGFENLNHRLKKRISELNLASSDKEKIKESISAIANFFIDELEIILQNEDVRFRLANYLDGEPVIEPQEEIISEKQAELAVDKIDPLFSAEIYEELNNPSFLQAYQNIKAIAMMYGYEDVEAIADYMLRIIEKFPEIDKVTEKILFEGKELIEAYISDPQQVNRIKDALIKFKNYLNNSSPGEEESLTENSQLIYEDDDKNEGEDFKLPGEDDPELLALLSEIPGYEGEQKSKPLSRSDDTYNISIVKDEHNEDEILAAKDEGVSLLTADTHLYFKLLNQALKRLIKKNNDKLALEDLELASSSLKSHAIKFGFEKLGQLPDAIEDIAIISNQEQLGIPREVLHTIAEAVFLLQTFIDDETSREKFKMIFYELNQYLQNLRQLNKQHNTIHL